MSKDRLPDLKVPADMTTEEMPDLLRYWYLGSRARRHMMLRRFFEVDREIAMDHPGKVLDIGSAWGYNTMALAAQGVSAVAVDLITGQFAAGARIARENGVDFVAVGGDASRLPFTAESFQSITMVETFEHVFEEDRSSMLAECHRVLQPGGMLVLSTPNYASVVERFKRVAVRYPWLQSRLPTMCYPAEGVTRGDYHPYRYHSPFSTAKIIRLLSEAGFEVSRTKYFLFVLKNTPNALFSLGVGLESILERSPLGRLAATVCIAAHKPKNPS